MQHFSCSNFAPYICTHLQNIRIRLRNMHTIRMFMYIYINDAEMMCRNLQLKCKCMQTSVQYMQKLHNAMYYLYTHICKLDAYMLRKIQKYGFICKKNGKSVLNLPHTCAGSWEHCAVTSASWSDSPPSDDASFKLLVFSIRVSCQWVLFPLSMHRQVGVSLLRLSLARLRLGTASVGGSVLASTN